MAKKILKFPQQKTARERLATLSRLYWICLYLVRAANFTPEDIALDAILILMPVNILYPLYKATSPLHTRRGYSDLVTVVNRPAENLVFVQVELFEIWSKRKRVILSHSHKQVLNAERLALKDDLSTMPVSERDERGCLTDYVAHVINWPYVLSKMQRLLASWGVRLSTRQIKADLDLISYAYRQSNILGYPVVFRPDRVFAKTTHKKAA